MPKEFIVYSEYQKAKVYPPLGSSMFIDEINFRVLRGKGGLNFEFNLKLEELGGKPVLRFEAFDDSFKLFTHCTELFKVIAKYHSDFHHNDAGMPPDVLEKIAVDIQKKGWKRKIPEKRDLERPKPVCPKCGLEGKRSVTVQGRKHC